MIKKGFVASFLLQKVLFSDGSCVPKPQRLRRFVITPLSARLCLFLLSLSSFSKDISEILRRNARSTTENRAALPAFAVLTAFPSFLSRIGKSRMFHVKHSAFSCFLPLFFSVFSSLFQPVLFRFFLPLCSARCFSLLFTLFFGRFLLFCASQAIFRRIFLDLGVAFCPFSSFCVPFYISFGIFVVFGLLYRFCRGARRFSCRFFTLSPSFPLRFALFFRFFASLE